MGGRIFSQDINGFTVEIGAVYFHSINKYMMNLVDELGLEVDTMERQSFGLWDGDQFVFKLGDSDIWNTLKMLWRYGFKLIKINSLVNEIKSKINKFYELEDKEFDTLEEMTKLFNFKEEAFTEFGQLLRDKGFSEKILNELINPTTRYVYHHSGTEQMNGFSGLVSMTAYDNSPVYFVKGGFDRIFNRLDELIDMDVLLSTPVNMIKKINDGFEIHTETQQSTFDEVVIATPIDVSGIEITGIDGLDLMNRNYKGYVKTIIIGSPSSDFFNQDSVDDIPPMLLTKESEKFPIYGFEKLGEVDGGNIYEITSTNKLDQSLLEDIFVTIVKQREFSLPYTFPNIEPVSKYDPIILDDNIYYISSVDSLSPSLESTLVVSKNISNKILKKYQ